MADLSSEILRAQSVREIDALLEAAIRESEVELIGELDINEDAFAKSAEVLRSQCLIYDHIYKHRIRPAIFVASLVFSARYSQDAIRSFWQPYAQDVWNMGYSDEFYRASRSVFFRARHHLAANFDLDLFGRSYGDVVYPIYRHAIIPGYLHDDFARWFVSRLGRIRGLNRELLSLFIQHPDITRYIAPTLKAFLVSSDTHNVALEIIQELTNAIDLLAEGHAPKKIRELLPSLIQRELWDKALAELSTGTLARSTRQRHAHLEWVWADELEDWVLRLRNLIADRHQKPRVCIWSKANEHEALDDSNARRENIWPELQADGRWYQGEIPLETPDELDMLAGSIYVFDEKCRCIFKQPVPQLPQDGFQFYRITQQRIYAVPINPGQLVSGECLISYRGDLKLLDTDGQVISPLQTDFYVSEIMQEIVGHRHIARYGIDIPITIVSNGTELPVAGRQRRILRAHLSDGHRVSHTSERLPPVYTSNQISITFSEMPVSIEALSLHIATPTGQLYEPLSAHAEWDGENHHLNLQDFIPPNRIGTYTVDITRGFRSRLDSPVEFCVLPNLELSGPGEDVFHPYNLPSSTISNAENIKVESPDNSANVTEIGGAEWRATWKVLHSKYCRVHIRQDDQIVPVEWTVERIFAWIDKGAGGRRLHPVDLATAKIHFRGLRNKQLEIMVGDARHTIDLNARGAETIDLNTDQLQDELLKQRTSEVPLKLRLDGAEWQFGTFVRRPQIVHFRAQFLAHNGEENLLINTKLSEALQARYELQIINTTDRQMYIEEVFDNLPSTIKLDCQLPDGTYSIRIRANGEELRIPGSNVFEIAPPSVDIKVSYEDFRLRFDYAIDNWRTGSYELMVLDSYKTCVLSEPLDRLDHSFIASVDPLVQGRNYDILIKWMEVVVGRAALSVPYPEITQFSMSYEVNDDKEWILYKISASEIFLSYFNIRIISRDNRATLTSLNTTELEGKVLLDSKKPCSGIELQIWTDARKLELPGKSIVQLGWPSVLIDSVDYKADTVTVAYNLFNIRPGQYALEVTDEDRKMAMSYMLNPTVNNFAGAANLARGSKYTAQIRWNEMLIGQPFPFYVTRRLNLSIRGIIWPE